MNELEKWAQDFVEWLKGLTHEEKKQVHAAITGAVTFGGGGNQPPPPPGGGTK